MNTHCAACVVEQRPNSRPNAIAITTRGKRKRRRYAALSVMAVLSGVAGCASEPEPLERKSGLAPAGIDFTGQWLMQDDFDAMQRRIARAIRDTDGVDERDFLRRSRAQPSRSGRSSRRDVGGLVHVFLKNAARLRISQTADGLFVGFGRSVVEEYRFGEARRVSIGGAAARRVSGWEDDTYVIETLGDSGMKLTERFRLLGADGRLEREIVLRSKELEQVAIVQTFQLDRR